MRSRIGMLRTLARGRPGNGAGTGAANDNLRGQSRARGAGGRSSGS